MNENLQNCSQGRTGWMVLCVEAETAEEAIEQWRYKVDNGEVDFGDMEMVSSEDTVEG